MDIIAKHLPENHLRERFKVINIDNGRCCITNKIITQGLRKKDIIKATFGDRHLIKNDSPYISLEIGLMMCEIIKGSVKNGKQNWNALRSYNAIFTENEAQIGITKAQVLAHILRLQQETPFVVLATFSQKKHIAYFAKPQYNPSNFTIFTDKGELFWDVHKSQHLKSLLDALYCPIPDKPKYTFFNKKDLLNLANVDFRKIKTFGKERFMKIYTELAPHLDSFLWEFLVDFTPSPIQS